MLKTLTDTIMSCQVLTKNAIKELRSERLSYSYQTVIYFFDLKNLFYFFELP
jgi:hypothetical protein